MEAQIGLGADIIMGFDECTDYRRWTGTKASMELTLRWAERSKNYFRNIAGSPWKTVVSGQWISG